MLTICWLLNIHNLIYLLQKIVFLLFPSSHFLDWETKALRAQISKATVEVYSPAGLKTKPQADSKVCVPAVVGEHGIEGC